MLIEELLILDTFIVDEWIVVLCNADVFIDDALIFFDTFKSPLISVFLRTHILSVAELIKVIPVGDWAKA